MAGLSRAADSMRHQATDMSGAAGRTRELARVTAEGAAMSSENLAAVAAAAEEMSNTINEIGKQVSRATSAVRTTVDRAATTDTKIGSLVQATQRVGDVVQLIARIAAGRRAENSLSPRNLKLPIISQNISGGLS